MLRPRCNGFASLLPHCACRTFARLLDLTRLMATHVMKRDFASRAFPSDDLPPRHVEGANGCRPRLLRERATEGSTSSGQSVSDGREAGGEHRVPKNRVHRLSLTQYLA